MMMVDARIMSLISSLGIYMTAEQNQMLSDVGSELSSANQRIAEQAEEIKQLEIELDAMNTNYQALMKEYRKLRAYKEGE